jgi:hypothetical protein
MILLLDGVLFMVVGVPGPVGLAVKTIHPALAGRVKVK